MAENIKQDRRSRVGYGSTYSKGNDGDQGIKTVLGGQVWTVKPDKKAKASYPCIWMQAGAVKNKNCNNFYDCTTCKYDYGMQNKVKEGKHESWQDAMRKKPALARICRHSLTSRIDMRACAYDYHCEACDFDQYFEDIWSAKTKSLPGAMEHVKGFDVPMNYHFHNGHTWARIESGGYVRIGLDDFALKLLGNADALDLPLMGKELDQGTAGWGLKRKDNTADILSPVNGVIMEVNAHVRKNPGIANHEPYGDGWLFMVRTPDVKKTVNSLMTNEGTLDWMNNEIATLETMVEDVTGPLAADGGYFSDDIYGNLPDLGWSKLTHAFLKT